LGQNANGVAYGSLGFGRTPGNGDPRQVTLKGLRIRFEPSNLRNLFEVQPNLYRNPRVQEPWAAIRNPVGIQSIALQSAGDQPFSIRDKSRTFAPIRIEK
jgi:hypothetical protein